MSEYPPPTPRPSKLAKPLEANNAEAATAVAERGIAASDAPAAAPPASPTVPAAMARAVARVAALGERTGPSAAASAGDGVRSGVAANAVAAHASANEDATAPTSAAAALGSNRCSPLRLAAPGAPATSASPARGMGGRALGSVGNSTSSGLRLHSDTERATCSQCTTTPSGAPPVVQRGANRRTVPDHIGARNELPHTSDLSSAPHRTPVMCGTLSRSANAHAGDLEQEVPAVQCATRFQPHGLRHAGEENRGPTAAATATAG